jgi:hypothetical protein
LKTSFTEYKGAFLMKNYTGISTGTSTSNYGIYFK